MIYLSLISHLPPLTPGLLDIADLSFSNSFNVILLFFNNLVDIVAAHTVNNDHINLCPFFLFFLAFDFCQFCVVIRFFIPATTANALQL